MRKNLSRVLALLISATLPVAASGQPSIPPMEVVPAADKPGTIPLYGLSTPGVKDTEIWFKWYEGQVLSVRNVTYPTLTPVLPAPGKANGAAVIVAPGGAFEFLSMEHEGWNVANALAAQGVTAFVLKYRVKPTPLDQQQWTTGLITYLNELVASNKAATEAGVAPAPAALEFPQATADGLAAIQLVRANASRWGIDPKHVGIIGFSAGAALALNTVRFAQPGERPNFFALIYGPLQKVPVPPQAPPLFAAVAIDDPLFFDTSLPRAWHDAGAAAELHVYQTGGHGFGLGRGGSTNALMLDQFIAWLAMQGFVQPAPASPK